MKVAMLLRNIKYLLKRSDCALLRTADCGLVISMHSDCGLRNFQLLRTADCGIANDPMLLLLEHCGVHKQVQTEQQCHWTQVEMLSYMVDDYGL